MELSEMLLKDEELIPFMFRKASEIDLIRPNIPQGPERQDRVGHCGLDGVLQGLGNRI